MDEIGSGIVADAAEFQIQAGLPKRVGVAPGQTDIDGTSQHVIAELGHPAGLFAQLGIRLGGAVTGNDVKGGTGAQAPAHGKKEVHQPGIHVFDVTGAVVPQDSVYLSHGSVAIGAIFVIADTEAFAGVRIIQVEGATGVVRQQGGPPGGRHQAGGQETRADSFDKTSSTASTHVYLRHSAY